jgi:hypothetical protein
VDVINIDREMSKVGVEYKWKEDMLYEMSDNIEGISRKESHKVTIHFP